MALPITTTPTYKMKLYSTGEEIEFRPFLVKEEKILLLAIQDQENNSINEAVKQIINNCTFGKVDVEKLPMFDIENIFLRLRERSVGEIAEFRYACQSSECEHSETLSVNLSDIQVQGGNVDGIVRLTPELSVTMSYPSLDTFESIRKESINSVDGDMDFVVRSINAIHYGEQTFNAKEHSREDLVDFIENLTRDQFSKIREFFQNMPMLEHTLEYDCTHCGHHNIVKLRGLSSFLA
jgi:hypothetical protein